MKTSRELHAHHIVDKNGKRTVVWKKPTAESSSKLKDHKLVLIPKVSEERKEDEQAISRYLDHFNASQDAAGKSLVSSRAADVAIAKCSDKEVRAITEGLAHGEDWFQQIVFRTGADTTNMDSVLGTVALYEQGLYEGERPMTAHINLNMQLDAAHAMIYGSSPQGMWNLLAEDDDVVVKVKRFAHVWQALGVDDSPKESHEPLLHRALDDSLTDHDAALEIIRQNPTVTLAQLEFILEGGESMMSSGML